MQNIKKLSFISFFFSGFSALTYQILFKRFLSLALGSTVYAISTVLALFMLGLGMGSITGGRLSDKLKKPVPFYIIIEILTGLVSLLILLSMKNIIKLSANTPSLIKSILLISPFLLLPSILMGSTFPVLSRILEPFSKEKGVLPGGLYFINTCGGITGALFTGLFLIKYLGMYSSALIASIFNILAGVLLLRFSREKSPLNTEETPYLRATSLLFIAFFTGFAGIGLEVFWNRVLGIYLPNTTYTFSTILIVYLSGLTLGAFVYYTKIKNRNPYSILGFSLSMVSLYTLLSLILIPHLPDIVFVFPFVKNPGMRYIYAGVLLSIFLFLPSTFFMGLTFPALLRIFTKKENPGGSTGLLYFMNTLGSTLGPLFAGFFLIPTVGIYRGIVITGIIYSVMVFMISFKGKKTSTILASVSLIFLLIFLIKPSSMILPPSIKRAVNRRNKILFYSEYTTGTVVVVEDELTGIRACYVDNSVVVGTAYDAIKTVKLLGHLPLLLHSSPESVLVIGYGTGITTSSIALHSEVKNIDCVEIAQGLDTASKLFLKFNRDVLKDKRVRYFVNDGRNFLLKAEKKYDIITCDPTHPALGSGSLYTVDFYNLVKRKLKDNGIFAEYFPLHRLGNREFKIMLKTFVSSFPYSHIWVGGAHGIFIGSKESISVYIEDVKKKMSELEVYKDLSDIYSETIYKLTKSYFIDGEIVKNITCKERVNSDNHPYLEFFGFKSGEKENWDVNLSLLLKNRILPSNIFEGGLNIDSLSIYRMSSDYFYRAMVYKNRGDWNRYLEFLRKAFRVNESDQEYWNLFQFALEEVKRVQGRRRKPENSDNGF